jgi:hypothetical protein
MFRRTHDAKFFGHPILRLPGIGERIIEVVFNEAEDLLYKTFITKWSISIVSEFHGPGLVSTY